MISTIYDFSFISFKIIRSFFLFKNLPLFGLRSKKQLGPIQPRFHVLIEYFPFFYYYLQMRRLFFLLNFNESIHEFIIIIRIRNLS